MVIPVVFLLLVVVSPTTAITLDTDGAFNGRLVDAGGIDGGGDGGLGLGFIAAPLIGLAVLAAIAGSTNTRATVCPAPCNPMPACPANYQRLGIPAGVAGVVLQSCYRVITPLLPVDFRGAAQLCDADNAVPVEFNTAGESEAVAALIEGNAGTFLTGHTDAFNTPPMINVIIGINSGLPAVGGVAFPAVGIAGNECGVISGVGAPSLRALCTDTSTGVVCEISLDGECFCPAGTG